ncbi:MAG: PDZ domain-containing protein, partial [Acidobacteriota bacterium]
IISNINDTMLVGNRAVESPAAKAGLKLNDIVLEFRGERIKDDSDLVRRVASAPVGTSAPIKIFRDGKEMTLSVTVSQRPGSDFPANPEAAKSGEAESSPRQNIGISVQTLTPTRILERALGEVMGVTVIRVEAGSISDDAGLKVNDVIEAINRQQVRNTDGFKDTLSGLSSGEPVVLQVYRQKLYPNPRIFISFNRP